MCLWLTNNSCSMVDEYILTLLVVSETPKTDILQCALLVRFLASQFHVRSGLLTPRNTPSDIGRNIIALTIINR